MMVFLNTVLVRPAFLVGVHLFGEIRNGKEMSRYLVKIRIHPEEMEEAIDSSSRFTCFPPRYIAFVALTFCLPPGTRTTPLNTTRKTT